MSDVGCRMSGEGDGGLEAGRETQKMPRGSCQLFSWEYLHLNLYGGLGFDVLLASPVFRPALSEYL
jgi:hypothetical protein